jgi:hypothetical protein
MSVSHNWLGPVRAKSRSREVGGYLVGLGVTPPGPTSDPSQPRTAPRQRHRAVADHDLAAKPQLGVDPAGAVGAARAPVDLGDQVGQPGVADRAGRRRSGPPVVVARHRHAHHPAGQLDGDALAGHHPDRFEAALGGTTSRSSSMARRVARSSVWKLGDPPLGRGQLGPFGAAQARFQAAVDPGSWRRQV